VFVALVIQNEKRMRQIVVCGLSGSTVLFPPYLLNGTIFEKKYIEHKMCVSFSLQIVSETFLVPRIIKRDNRKCRQVFMRSARYSPQILMKSGFFSTDFRKAFKYQHFMKAHPVGAEFYGDGQTGAGRQTDRDTWGS
jgi:hypothetical protein